ncbi:unnamed protein product [Didymodactylos carnosus]|uniref:Uncharacterized protein n=1 Tax=Didymodactylos carnosus TaxID=1234261 RepID=A0A8S2RK96_9BILA|nr:unnamed protein product [Didymodactylos carnosus]CAF4166423.1 unnamed protein product [Didymodactylos carnosus]
MTSPRISRSALLEAFLNALTWGVQHDWLKKIWKTNHENIRSEVLALYHKSQQESLGGELVVFSNKPNEDEATCLASTCCICKLKKYLTRENATMVKSHKVEEKLQNGYLKLYGVQLGVPLLNKSIHSVCYRKLLYHASRITSANTSTGSLKRAASQPVPATSQSIPFSNGKRLLHQLIFYRNRWFRISLTEFETTLKFQWIMTLFLSLLASSANITDDSPPTSLAKPVDHHILHSVSAPVKKQIGTKSTIRRILTARLPFLSTSKKERLSPIADANHEKKERCSSSIQSESTISFGPSIKLPAESISSSSSILSSEHLAYRELTQQSSLDVSLLRMGDSIISNRLFEAIPEDVTQFAFCSSTPITPRRSMREVIHVIIYTPE